MDRETTLLVDDEDAVRGFLKRVLQADGCRVVEARNGSEALQLLRELGDEICVILTDISMPDMNGIALANAVRELFPAMPIILMSALPEEDWPERPRGAWTFVPKPMKRESLLKALRSVRFGQSKAAGSSKRIA